MKKLRMRLLILFVLLLCSCTVESAIAPAFELPPTNWKEDETGRYYVNADGTRAIGWLEEDAAKYYLDESGYMHTGWLELGGSTYYFREDGTMAQGAVTIDGANYHFAADGTYVLLVNPWNPVPDGYAPDLVELSYYVAVSDCYADSTCAEALTKMVQDCNANTSTGVCIVSAYRSNEQQDANFRRRQNIFMSEGLSEEEAYKKTLEMIALPGTSEHHLGLAADIVDKGLVELVEEQESTEGQKWLMANCYKYGFVLRYPKDKTEVTGIIYEPWHYRYVGVELATHLHNSGLTLEEYMAGLTQ